MHTRKISVIGLGYVGLPVAAAFAANGDTVIAYDINAARVEELKNGQDRTGEIDVTALKSPFLNFTNDPGELGRADFHIVTVPTPITPNRQPDLRPLISASQTVGKHLKKGDIVVYESTVYPGATEEKCVPILERESGLTFGKDFTVGYSPERINPGDTEHRLDTIVKVVSGSDPETLDIVADVYRSVVDAGVHIAPSIKVAEAAKVIENTQRDLNIALMNELSLIFDLVGIRTKDVLDAAGTKWNFLPFSPGLVGGHCIGVDPYYLTSKAEDLGYLPQVILSGRRINDGMGKFIAQKLIKMLTMQGKHVLSAKIGVLGITFKENVPDIRNSRVPDIVHELHEYNIEPLLHDPMANETEVFEEYQLSLVDFREMRDLDALIVAVPHKPFLENQNEFVRDTIKKDGILIDVKSAIDPTALPATLQYWSL